MDNRPSPAKISRPKASDTVSRTRLFKLLDRTRRKPLLWVMGPPGSGKTMLVADYLERRRITTLWYQADPGDADIATFFYYLGLAAKKPRHDIDAHCQAARPTASPIWIVSPASS